MAPKRPVTDADISHLRTLLASTSAEVRAPGDPGYNHSIERWSRAAEKPAGVAIAPTTAEEVALAVKYATDAGLDLGVKGGGHSTAGASSTHGGVLIDLGRMRGVSVDVERRWLRVQGGCLWADVDAAAWEHGLATVGGTVADTGVGGLTLGGGYGVLSGKRGLVIDNMVAATVVLASGEVVTASEEENAELFWALKGAGQNFGVTTEFVLQAFPQRELYMGTLLFAPTPETVGKLVAAVNELYTVRDGPEGPETKSQGKAMSLIGFAKPPPAEGKTMILLNAVVDGTEEEAKALLQPILDIGPVVNHMRMDAYPECNKLVPAMIGLRSSMKGAAFTMPIREQFVLDVLAKFDGFIEGQCEDAAPSLVAWELYDTVAVAKGEAGSFANRGYHMNSLVMPVRCRLRSYTLGRMLTGRAMQMWTKAENDQQCRQFARDVSNMFKKEIERAGSEPSAGIEGGASVRGSKGAVMLYGNYDVSEKQTPTLEIARLLWASLTSVTAIRRDLARHFRRQLLQIGEAEGEI